jgi:tetratricopeptide (TPR) repeat protein
MSKKDNFNTEDKQLESHLSDFLSNNQKLLGIIAIVLVIAVIVIGIVNAVMNNKALKNFDALDKAQTELSTATANPDSETYADDLAQAITDLQALEDVKGYVGLKSSYLLALQSYNDKDYQAALDSFLVIKDDAKNTYLGSLSLSNAAVCAEQLGDDAKAIEYCQELIDVYGNDAAETPKAMFTLARIYEKQGNSDLAQGQFQQLADQFSSSEYGKLAKNSLLNY